MNAVLILASLGLLLNLLGRWMIVREANDLSRAWRWVLMTLPLAELAFIVQRGERARRGSLLCALSIALILPLVGQTSALLRNRGVSATALLFDAQTRAAVFNEAGSFRVNEAERVALLARKEAKLREISDYLERWHLLLAERRDMICDEGGEETRRFNEDVTAYHGLLAAARIELAEWKGLAKGRDPLAVVAMIEP